MSLSHAPQTVTNGLAFYYDMSNSKKSWLGATTTNLISNGDMSSGITGYNTYETTPTIVTANDVPSTYGITRNVLQSTGKATPGGGGTYGGFNMTAPSFTAGQPYTISFYARSLGGSMTFGFSNQNGSGDNSNFSTTWTLTGQWQLFTKTTTSLDLVKTQMYFYNSNLANTSFQIADLQIENRSFASPFTLTSRSNTQNILDLTKNLTITSTSLTYNSDGSFSFDGAANYIDTGSYFNSIITGTSAFSLEFWINPGTTQVSNADIFGNHSDAFTGIVIQQNGSTTNQFYFAVGNGAAFTSSSNFNLTASVYNHLIVAKNSTYTSVYVNGTRVVYDNITASISPNTNYTVKIGLGYQGGVRFFNGKIPVAKIYNRELSTAEVVQNYNAHRGKYGL